MLKSLEEYLSGLSFDPPNPEPGKLELNSGERIFVEKYLGADALRHMPVQEPEPLPLPQLLPKPAENRPDPETRLIVAPPAPVILVAQEESQTEAAEKPLTHTLVVAAEGSAIETAPTVKSETAAKTAVKAPDLAVSATGEKTAKTEDAPQAVKLADKSIVKTAAIDQVASEIRARVADDSPGKVVEKTTATVAARAGVERIEKASAAVPQKNATVAPPATRGAENTATTTCAQAGAPVKTVAAQRTEAKAATKIETGGKTAPAAASLDAELSLREKMRQASEIQVVSFLVSGQIFLLPVAGIQEVLRYMELVKVPQAPAFVAGAINLRGTVMPLIHLSALLTNSSTWKYDEQSFIIVTGSSSMQMGLIIDKVSSMHIIPQTRIIWNAESKLGEAAEFLSAIVDLDDKVCGMIAPEAISQKLIAEF